MKRMTWAVLWLALAATLLRTPIIRPAGLGMDQPCLDFSPYPAS